MLVLRSAFVALLSLGLTVPQVVEAMPVGPLNKTAFEARIDQIAARKVPAGKGGGSSSNRNTNKNTNVNRNTTVNKNTNVNRNVTANKNVNRNVNVNTNVNRNVTVNVRHGAYRPWVARPYYGRVIAGVALGTVITATAIGIAPAPPQSDLCWFWSDNRQVSGYWDYCS